MIIGKDLYLYIFLLVPVIKATAQYADHPVVISYAQLASQGINGRGSSVSSANYDLDIYQSVLEFRASQIRNLPRSVSRISFYRLKKKEQPGIKPRFQKIATFNRRSIRKSIYIQWQERAGDLISWELKNKKGTDSVRYRNYRQGNFLNYLKGNSNGNNNFSSQWFILAGIPITKNDLNIYCARVRIPFRKDLFIYNDTVPSSAYASLPQADTGTCVPLERFFAFKKLMGYGYQNIHPLQYIPFSRKVFKKEFEIYFERNSTRVSPMALDPVINFLKENRFTILNASVEGYSSVEGPEENNFQLQRKRAQLLIAVLQQNNEEEISLDTVIAAENWGMFFKQIKDTPYQYLDSLSRDSLRVLLKDSLLLVKLEPYLKEQRKAILTLTLAEIFSREEINSNILKDIFRLNRYISSMRNEKLSQNNFNKASGLLYAIEYRVDKKLINKEEVANTLQEVDNPVMWVSYFYLAIRKFENGGHTPSIFTWPEVIQKAQDGIINLIHNATNSSLRNMYLMQGADIQYYAFNFMRNNTLNWRFLCDFDYPDEPVFYALILNRYAFVYNYAGDHISEIPCAVDIKPDFEAYGNGHYLQRYSMAKSLVNLPGYPFKKEEFSRWKEKPAYATEYEGAYYFFLKKLFVRGDERIKSFIIQSDKLYEFDLFELVARNVENWDPVNNYFYDEDIDMNVMFRLIESLKSVDARICPMQKNQLYLDFYLKCLYYYKLFGNPYDHDEIMAVENSIYNIGEYYLARAYKLPVETLLAVVRQLNLFYGLPGREISTLWSYKILREGHKHPGNSFEENRLFWEMASFYENNFILFAPKSRELNSDICKFFQGKYHLKPWRKDVRELYNDQCGDLNQ